MLLNALQCTGQPLPPRKGYLAPNVHTGEVGEHWPVVSQVHWLLLLKSEESCWVDKCWLTFTREYFPKQWARNTAENALSVVGFTHILKVLLFSSKLLWSQWNWLRNAVGDKDKLTVRTCLKPNSGCHPGGSMECRLVFIILPGGQMTSLKAEDE